MLFSALNKPRPDLDQHFGTHRKPRPQASHFLIIPYKLAKFGLLAAVARPWYIF